MNKVVESTKLLVQELRNVEASNAILSAIDNFNVSLTEDSTAGFENLVTQLCKYATVPDADFEKELPNDHFEDYIHDAVILLQLILEIFLFLVQDKEVTERKLNISVIAQTLLICASHSDTFEWTNGNTCSLSKRIVQCVIEYSEVISINDLLGKNSASQSGLAKSILMMIMPRLAPNIWKENPAIKHIFTWTLHRIKHPHLFDLIIEVLPPSLLFVDDYVMTNKVLGIQCLQHIISNINPTELKWYGRAEVIYSALEHLLYTREAEVVPYLYPCILQILCVVEVLPTKNLKFNRFDKVFVMLLTHMEQESKLVLRTTYALQLSQFIDKLQITVVKHMKQLLRVLESYLEEYDTPEEITRKTILVALNHLLLVAWPRIPCYMEVVMKFLLKLSYDLENDEIQSPSHVKLELMNKVQECLILLKMTSPDKFEKLALPLLDENIETSVKRIISHALETKECTCDNIKCESVLEIETKIEKISI